MAVDSGQRMMVGTVKIGDTHYSTIGNVSNREGKRTYGFILH